MTTILEVQDGILKVQGELEELRKRLQEEMPEAERAHLWKKEELLMKKEDKLMKKEDKLRKKELLLVQSGQNSTALLQDRSGEWIKHMLMPGLTTLPQHDYDLAMALFPEKHGKLPVLRRTYHERLMKNPDVTESFLIEADDSAVPYRLTFALTVSFGPVVSEMDVSGFVGLFLRQIFGLCRSYSPSKFTYQFFSNCNERTAGSRSSSTKKRSRPDTLLTASGCTFLIGGDKLSSLSDAEADLTAKVRPLSTMFYGELQFILGYIAAGSAFQWLSIGKSGVVRRVGPTLDLSTDVDRCQYLLSIGYAYQLIKKMIDSVPQVPGRHAMFTEDIVGDRTICFFPDKVKKSIENFDSFCREMMTGLDVILRAYKAGEGWPSLPQLVGKKSDHYISRTGTYTVEIRPLGHAPILRSEQSIRTMAKNVCEALSVLHKAGLVHRDVRLPNVVQVSQEQFMLIDLETVAASPFQLPQGFQYFREWSIEMLEGNLYTPMSDMYQLGRLLEKDVHWMPEISESALQFIRKLRSKECTALMALSDPWLSDPVL
ncbi:unnamed protein product [Sphagnum troendelagicum]|uniref:Protein kinase domain-containing protein n=1 Tax=Sphagnum troendelagicum TaxID=128251 RepID=A0ABP0TDC0_9BRYO